MRKKYAILLLLLIILITGCSQEEVKTTNTYFYLDTVITITLYEDNPSLFNAIEEEILRLENIFDFDLEASEVYQLNESKSIQASSDLIDIINQSIKISEETQGYFDITSGPLIDLWDINNRADGEKPPNKEDIDRLRNKVNYQAIEINNNNVTIATDQKINLGAIAKGYIADQIITLLKEHDIEKALIDLGGNTYVLGEKSENTLFKIGIQNPFKNRGEIVASFVAKNESIVTSGIYERYFETDGQLYHHLINPYTGYPSKNELLSVSIITPSSTLADGLSTGIFLMGLEEGLKTVENLKDVEAIFITKSKDVYATSGIMNKINIHNSDYQLKDNLTSN